MRHPELGFLPLPSDQTFELPNDAAKTPGFVITRHKREQALRAVVEILRLRTIITPDGIERNELEIALQNKTEQFLKLAFPYPKDQISIYEVQVASRPVKITFSKQQGKDVLLIPLIRTGLLEPELTVRVAYVIKDRKPLKGRGSRTQTMPQVLGDIPVAQSALVLMLPSSFKYNDFEGTMNQVELLDIEVDEALRQAKQVEKLSEAVLYAGEDKQKKLLGSLRLFKSKVSSRVKYAKDTKEAYVRRSKAPMPGKKGVPIAGAKLIQKRDQTLDEAKKAEQQILMNVQQLEQMVEAQERQQTQIPQAQQAIPQAPQVQQAQMPEYEPPPEKPSPPIGFPRKGDVFVFRQLQGTGNIRFKFASRESFNLKLDILVWAIVLIFLGIILHYSARLFSTKRRVAVLLFVLSVIAIILGFAVDVAIPLLGFCIILFIMGSGKRGAGRALSSPDQ